VAEKCSQSNCCWAQASSREGHSGAVQPKFFVSPKYYCDRKNLFQTYNKNKTIAPPKKNVFCQADHGPGWAWTCQSWPNSNHQLPTWLNKASSLPKLQLVRFAQPEITVASLQKNELQKTNTYHKGKQAVSIFYFFVLLHDAHTCRIYKRRRSHL